jgi:hypothetical protein
MEAPKYCLRLVQASALFVACLIPFPGCGGGGGGASAGFLPPTNSWTGVKQFGVSGQKTEGFSVATDTSDNVYVAGFTDGGLDGNTLTGLEDFFVAKYDSKGVKQFTNQLGVSGASTRGNSVATDASGNVYVAGYTNGGLDGNALTGTMDLFVTKYDGNGTKQFTQQLGVSGASTAAMSVATDASGNVYVAGWTTGGLDGNALSGSGSTDFFVTKYDSSGMKQYTKQLGVSGATTMGNSVATDASGNVYVAGYTNGGLDGNTLAGIWDFIVTKYDSGGVKQYTKQMGVSGQFTQSYAVATDASGNVYIVGTTSGALDGITLTGIGDFFVTKYDSSGVKQYTQHLGVPGGGTVANSVATDANGNVYVTGYTNGGLDGNTQTGPGDCFVTKYSGDGTKHYTRQLGASPSAITFGCSVATDSNGNAYIAGYTYGGLAGNTLTGVQDCFIAKYTDSGILQ